MALRLKIKALFFIIIIMIFTPYYVLAQDEEALDSDLYYFYGLDDQVDVNVDVASLFMEDELVLGSTVSQITPDKWKQMGARRTYETLNNEMSVITHPFAMGSYIVNIRGYTSASSHCGIAHLIDGVPLNEHRLGGGMMEISNWELGILNKIELIKGPGSAIYGSDAFSGVISMKTFESDTDYYAIEGAVAYPMYGDASMQLSHGMYDNLIRIDAAAGASLQDDINQKYEYDDQKGSVPFGLPPGKGTGTRKWKYDSEAGVLKLRIKPGDRLNIKVGGYLNRFKGDEFPGSHFGYETSDLREYDVSFNETVFYMGNGNINYNFKNKITVDASAYYWMADGDISASIGPDNVSFLSSTRQYSRSGACLTVKQPDNSINLQWLIAYSYGRYDIYNAKYSLYLEPLSFRIDDEDEDFVDFTREIHSVFTQLKWGLLKNKLYLLGGGRIDDYSDFGRQVTPRGGLILLPTDKSSLKALYGRAFRAPSITERYGIFGLIKYNLDIKPETIDQYELAYIYKEKQSKVSASVFYSYWKDGIIAEARDIGLFKGIYINSGRNRSWGGELNFYSSFEQTYALELGFSYVTSYALDAQDISDTTVTKDQKYGAFPEYSIHAGLHYTLKRYNVNFYLNNRIYLHIKEAPAEVIPDPDELPPYYRADLNIRKIFENNIEMYIDIRNIFNRHNRLPSIVGAENGYEEQGTSALLRVGYKL